MGTLGAMKRIAYSLLTFFLVMVSLRLESATQDGLLYSASAKAKGLPFNMTVSEERRTSTKSYLTVPGLNERTAIQARWLMCIYTELAMKRGFKYWTVVYPPEKPGQDQLVMAFSNSEKISPATLLGADFVAERTFGEEMNPVVVFQSFCKSAGFM
jgi:hypothetical protein